MTKMAAKCLKSIPNLWPKRLKNHTLLGRTCLYSPYKGVPPPGEQLWFISIETALVHVILFVAWPRLKCVTTSFQKRFTSRHSVRASFQRLSHVQAKDDQLCGSVVRIFCPQWSSTLPRGPKNQQINMVRREDYYLSVYSVTISKHWR